MNYKITVFYDEESINIGEGRFSYNSNREVIIYTPDGNRVINVFYDATLEWIHADGIMIKAFAKDFCNSKPNTYAQVKIFFAYIK